MEINISVKIPPINEAKITRAFSEYRKNSIERSQEILLDQIRQEISNRNMIVEGDMVESWRQMDLEETSDLSKVMIGSDDPAATAAEYGTSPAGSGSGTAEGDLFPDILQWVKRKPVTPRYGTQESFAFAIARKIAIQGLPLRGGLKRPFNAAQKKAKRKIDKVWAEGITDLIRDLESI
jgi:hypothetical protein